MVYFAAIAEAGSIRGAARQLGLSVPVISQALSDLEAELGLTLALRSTRSFALTEPGRRVEILAKQMLTSADAARALRTAETALTGTLSITLPNELATHWLPPLLAIYRQAHPSVALRIEANDKKLSLAGSAFDLAIRSAGLSHSDAARPMQFGLHCIASGVPPRRSADGGVVLDCTLLTTSPTATSILATDRGTGRPVRVTFTDAITVNNKDAARAMAQRGLGAVLVLEHSVGTGLIPVAPDLGFGNVAFEVVMRDRFPSPEARAFAMLCAENG